MGDVRRALLEADVNYQVARNFTNRVKDKALGEEVLRSVAPGQLLVKIVYDELVTLLGGASKGIKLSGRQPTVILVAGLQGSGKTTFCGKLALHLKGQGRVPLLAAADVYRPAAVDQLRTLAGEIDVPVYSVVDDTGFVVQDAPRVAREAVVTARKSAQDVVIIDTAGRLHVDQAMMAEVSEIKRSVNPSEILFVVDSMTGQDAVNTAREFNNQLDFTGVVLSKLDGDTRGGAALSIRSVVKKADQICVHRREAESTFAVPPGPHGTADLGHGRCGDVRRKGAAAVRPAAGRCAPQEDPQRAGLICRISFTTYGKYRQWGRCPMSWE